MDNNERLKQFVEDARILIKKLSEKEANPKCEQGHLSNQDENNPKITSSTVPQIRECPPSGGNTCHYKEPRKTLFEKVVKFFELLAIFAALVVAIVSCNQWKEMQKTRILDERAWVVPCGYSVEKETFRVEFKNTGRTPALNVDADVFSTDVINDVVTATWRKNPPGPYSGVLGPNIEGHANTERINGKLFYGRIWYDDIFGSRHWTDFSVYRFPETNAINEFAATAFGNATDDSKPEKTN